MHQGQETGRLQPAVLPSDSTACHCSNTGSTPCCNSIPTPAELILLPRDVPLFLRGLQAVHAPRGPRQVLLGYVGELCNVRPTSAIRLFVCRAFRATRTWVNGRLSQAVPTDELLPGDCKWPWHTCVFNWVPDRVLMPRRPRMTPRRTISAHKKQASGNQETNGRTLKSYHASMPERPVGCGAHKFCMRASSR